MDLKAWKGFYFVDPEFLSNVKLALALGDTGIAVTKNDDVFVINVNGLLESIRLDVDRALQSVPVKIRDLCQKGVTDLVRGNGFFLALTASGRLFVVGKLALDRACNENLHPMIPVAVGGQLRDKVVICAACGTKHVLALTDHGEVFAWGCNKDGRVGVPLASSPDGAKELRSPVKVTLPDAEESKVVSVSCGREFSVALTESGHVYCWGCNGDGQLGLPLEVTFCAVPTKLRASGLLFKHVVCGPAHAVGLTAEGHCYLWGRSSRPSVWRESHTRPVRVGEFVQGIVEVAATKYTSMNAMRAEKGIFVWGNTRLKGDVDRADPQLVDFPSTDLAFAHWSRHFAMWRPYKINSVGATGVSIPRSLLSEIFKPEDGILKIPLDRLKFSTDDHGEPMVLGVGFSAIVYLGNFDGQAVAVKKIYHSGKQDWRKTVLRELQVLVALGRHENVVRFVGLMELCSPVADICVVTEYCELGDLRSYLVKRRNYFVDQLHDQCDETHLGHYVHVGHSAWIVTTSDLLHWAYQFARGMEFLSSQNIIHGDLALRNLLLTDNRTLKVSDFGFSRRMHNDNYYVISNGYLPWATRAPESFDSCKLYSASDVWGYGVTLWEMFTLGDIPYKEFNAKNHPEGFFDAVKNGLRLGPPNFVPLSVYEIMTSCWELEPSRRPDFKTIVEQMHTKLLGIDKRITAGC